MNVLIIKTSSMGDIIHTFPALTDAANHFGDIYFDWVIEEAFQELPRWHSSVQEIIPVALRSWKHSYYSKNTREDIFNALRQLRAKKYDAIIDVQGLVKSATISLLARGKSHGYNFQSAREGQASIFYRYKYPAAKQQHAVQRARQLFAQALGYPLSDCLPDYGIIKQFPHELGNQKNLVFLPNTTWPTKHWPETYWRELVDIVIAQGYTVSIPWGNEAEHQRAELLAHGKPEARVLNKKTLTELANILAGADGVVAVDTGLAHLAAALEIPTVSLYGPTDPFLTGALGKNQLHLKANFGCAPCLNRHCHYEGASLVKPACFEQLYPAKVWQVLQNLMVSQMEKINHYACS